MCVRNRPLLRVGAFIIARRYAYDQDQVSQAVAERHPDAVVIVPPRAGALQPRPRRHSATTTCE
jgi:hypothetical protein